MARGVARDEGVSSQDRQEIVPVQVCTRADSICRRDLDLVAVALNLRPFVVSTKNKHLRASAVAAGKQFMTDLLNKTIVLVLNRNWQAINIRTPADAFCQMATNAATALDIEFDAEAESGSLRTPRSEFRASGIRPVQWDE